MVKTYRVTGRAVEIKYHGRSYVAGSEIEMDEKHAAELLGYLEPMGEAPPREMIQAGAKKIPERRVWKRRATDRLGE